MITADIRANDKRSAYEERRFNRWLQGSLLLGALLSAGLLAMAIAGLRVPQSEAVFARTPSFQQQHDLAHLENLPPSRRYDFHIYGGSFRRPVCERLIAGQPGEAVVPRTCRAGRMKSA